MTAPQQEQRGDRRSSSGNDRTPNAPVVPVVPGSMVAYLAYRALINAKNQEAIAADLARKMYLSWQLQDFNELDRSTVLWLSAAVPQVKTAYLQSQRLQAVYAHDVRMASLPTEPPLAMSVPLVELPDGVPALHFDSSLIPFASTDPAQPLVTFDEFPLEDAALSLTIQGNYGIKSAMPGPEDELMLNGMSNSTGAGVRHGMNGGRNVTNNLVQFDRKVIGYARVTDSNPCYFCALLASRGTDYGKGSFIAANKKFKVNPNGSKGLPAEFIPARTHDHCRCSLRPVYAKSQGMDAAAKFYFKQWEDTQKAWYWLDNKKQIEKFKEQYTPHDTPAPEIRSITSELKKRADAFAHDRLSPQSEWANRQLSQLA